MILDTDEQKEKTLMASRFRGYLPVVLDVETGGFDPDTDALLEIAIVTLRMDDDGKPLTNLFSLPYLQFHPTPPLQFPKNIKVNFRKELLKSMSLSHIPILL